MSVPDAITITVEEPDGRIHQVTCRPGMSLMDAIRWAGLPLRTSCGGYKKCGTCHVILDEASYRRIEQPDEDELDLLHEDPDMSVTSRLSCQIPVDARINDMYVKLFDPRRLM